MAKVTKTPAPAPVTKTRVVAPAPDPKQTQKEIEALLNDLRAATDPGEKKKIRRQLRKRGHRGGLMIFRQQEAAAEAE